MPRRIGVLSVQGDYAKHLEALAAADPAIEGVEVRTPEELSAVERLIIPGGESTTVIRLLRRFGLYDAMREAATEGMPIWGTCMGMILMAAQIDGHEEQDSLSILDISVRRNAFGAQVHSFEDEVEMSGFETPVMGVFIRAPVVTRTGPDVEVMAEYGDRVVAVKQGNLVGTSFHPEMTDDVRMHRWFLGL